MSWDPQPAPQLPQLPKEILDWIAWHVDHDELGRTYPGNPAREELLDRLNTRWRDGDTPPPKARYY